MKSSFTILQCVHHKEIIISLAAQLSNLPSSNKSCGDDGQTEMTASFVSLSPPPQTNLPQLSMKSLHGAINIIVSYDMYEINNNAALP